MTSRNSQARRGGTLFKLVVVTVLFSIAFYVSYGRQRTCETAGGYMTRYDGCWKGGNKIFPWNK